MSNGTKLCGCGIGSYRSFCGNGLALVGPWNKVHAITGQNNSGKSSLMRSVGSLVRLLKTQNNIDRNGSPFFDASDLPYGGRTEWHRFSICVSVDDVLELAKERMDSSTDKAYELNNLRRLLVQDGISHGDDGYCWIDFDMSKRVTRTDKVLPMRTQFESLSFTDSLRGLSLALCDHSGSEYTNYEHIARWIVESVSLPSVINIPAIRSARGITDEQKESIESLAEGLGLPEKLLRVKNPEVRNWEEAEDQERRIVDFIRQVLNEPEVDFNVAEESHEISVKIRNAPLLPLSSLGTGIEELLILAMTIATTSDSLICIEEPEIHLHPTLIHRFIEFLQQDPTNQFLLTTHSTAVINSADVSITHITLREGVSTATTVGNIVSVRDVLDDLGARASDILQSNYIVWVEGPSDRIYVNAWLHEADSTLTEGIHYSVMIYGGKLLSTLQATMEENADDLIRLMRINTHFCVLMDSDKRSAHARINDTKRRIKKECACVGAMSWVTWGATIENYYTGAQIAEALSKVHPNKTYDHNLGERYVHPLSFTFNGYKSARPDKTAMARALTRSTSPLDDSRGTNLRREVEHLASEIRKASGC